MKYQSLNINSFPQYPLSDVPYSQCPNKTFTLEDWSSRLLKDLRKNLMSNKNLGFDIYNEMSTNDYKQYYLFFYQEDKMFHNIYSKTFWNKHHGWRSSLVLNGFSHVYYLVYVWIHSHYHLRVPFPGWSVAVTQGRWLIPKEPQRTRVPRSAHRVSVWQCPQCQTPSPAFCYLL